MKFFFILISIIIIPGAFSGLIDSFRILITIGPVFYPLMAGTLASIIFYYAVIRRFFAISVFEHELTHALVALLFFRNIKQFISTSRGGYVSHSGGFGGTVGDTLILLAPYYLPTFTLIMCLLRPVIPGSWFPYYDAGVGITLGYHLASTLDEIIRNYSKRTFYYVGTNRLTYTDIGKVGLITSFFIIAAFTLMIHGIVFFMMTGGYPAVGSYFKQIFFVGWDLFLFVYYRLIFPLIEKLDILGGLREGR